MLVERYHKAKQSLLGHERRIWQAMEIYEPYLCVNRTFDNGNTGFALRGTSITVPDFKAYCQAIFGYSLQADWGKRLKNVA
jgi:hypothetical protein